MFVSNWYKGIKLVLTNKDQTPFIVTCTNYSCDSYGISGDLYSTCAIGRSISNELTLGTFGKSANIGKNLLMVGASDNAVSKQDYTLGSILETGLAHVSAGSTATVYSDKTVINITRTFQNTSGSTITVKETGLYVCTVYSYVVLLAREVLEEPIVVENGKTFTVTMNLEFT